MGNTSRPIPQDLRKGLAADRTIGGNMAVATWQPVLSRARARAALSLLPAGLHYLTEIRVRTHCL